LQFQDELAGGTILVRPVFQSPDYVAGASGWALNIDGSAEFSNVLIRGTELGDTVVVGPDTGSQVIIGYSGTDSSVRFPMNTASELEAGQISGRILNEGTANERLELLLRGPRLTPASDFMDLAIGSESVDGVTSLPTLTVHANANTMLTVDGTQGLVVRTATRLAPDFGAVVPLTIDLVTGSANLIHARNNLVDAFVVDDSGVLTTYGSNAWTTYTPTITGHGVATFTTRTGYWRRVGDLIHVVIYLVVNAAGSGATAITIDAPTDIERNLTTRQMLPGYAENITAAIEGACTALAFTGVTGPTFGRIRSARTNANITGADLLAGASMVLEGWYREG
jgi:hypothetical protein